MFISYNEMEANECTQISFKYSAPVNRIAKITDEKWAT